MHRENQQILAYLQRANGQPVEELVLTPEQIKEDEEEQKYLDSLRRKCDQCGEWLSVCIWGYPAKGLTFRYRTMGCVQGPGDIGKNWWCGECESFFE
jgi:hypothetical protein